jgi:hypothetical protein
MRLHEIDKRPFKDYPGGLQRSGGGFLSAPAWPPLPSSNAALLSSERRNIETHLSTWCRTASFDPTSTFVVVADLRGKFGRSLGLHLFDRVALDRRIRRAVADGVLPAFIVPVGLDHGVALVELVAPEWLAWLERRTLSSVPILAIDATDTPLLAFGRVVNERLH